MNNKTYLVFGFAFLISSGVVFTLERLRNAILLVAINTNENVYISSPPPATLLSNLVTLVFVLLSTYCFLKSRSLR